MNLSKKLSKSNLGKIAKLSIKKEVRKQILLRIASKTTKAAVFAEISEATGIGIPWLEKFTANCEMYDPGLSKIETLYFYFNGTTVSEKMKS